MALLERLGPILAWRLDPSEERCLIGTGYPISDIRFEYLARAFSSTGVRYCWRCALSSFEGRPCARCNTVERGTRPRSARAAYVLGSSGCRPSASTWLARSWLVRSMLTYFGDDDGKGNE